MKLCIDVDGQGTRELTKMERTILQTALAQYHTKKSAEKMLTIHKRENQERKETIEAQYNTLLRSVKELEETVA